MSFFSKIIPKSKAVNKTQEAVKIHLNEVRSKVAEEVRALSEAKMSDRAKGKRLLYLFQRDLLPGINGKILESKTNREKEVEKTVSFNKKVAGWTYLILLNASMLFYIFLFALAQSSMRQRAWLQSFLTWLVMEIFFVGTVVVYLTHIVIPSFTFKDLKRIKDYLVQSFRNKMKRKKNRREETFAEAEKTFNTASYLFVSHRVAALCPDLLESKVILAFQTPWPVQSYQHQTDLMKNYKGSFKAIQSSIATLAIYLISSAIDLPPALHDMTMDMVSTVTVGYVILVHLQLYDLYPILVIIPAVIIGVLIHFAVKANKGKEVDNVTPIAGVEEEEEEDELDLIKATDDIETLQTLLVERDKRNRREQLGYHWTDGVREEPVKEEGKRVEERGEEEKEEEKMGSLDTIDYPCFGDRRLRAGSNDSTFSRQSMASIHDEDLPASSRGSSHLPSPAYSVGADVDLADAVSSPIDSQSSASGIKRWRADDSDSDFMNNSPVVSRTQFENMPPLPISIIHSTNLEENQNEIDNYSMPSKESHNSKSVYSYTVSACSRESFDGVETKNPAGDGAAPSPREKVPRSQSEYGFDRSPVSRLLQSRSSTAMSATSSWVSSNELSFARFTDQRDDEDEKGDGDEEDDDEDGDLFSIRSADVNDLKLEFNSGEN